jgi:hypothetical protein
MAIVTSALIFLASLPLLSPPPQWECAKPKELSSYVQIGFIGKGNSSFRPSINLATEEVDVSLKQYVKAVKKIHCDEPHTSWRDLGKFTMQAGEGRLTEIDTASPWGKVKMLQALFVKDSTAYIITGASLKEEFLTFQKDFLDTFRSFSLIADLLSPLSKEKKAQFNALFTNCSQPPEERWKKMQTLAADCTDLGAHWNFLLLQEGHSKIFEKEVHR